MNISEEQLKALVLRILGELRMERRKKLYMICASSWDQRYPDFLKQMEQDGRYDICAVVPVSWQKRGYEAILRTYQSCGSVICRGMELPDELAAAVSVFPVADRTLAAKTALCISDSYESSWVAECIGAGGRVVFLSSGLKKFTGKETPAYVSQVMAYYRKILEYGIEICGVDRLPGGDSRDMEEIRDNVTPAHPHSADSGKKRVITASNVERLAAGGVLRLEPDDIVTDLARDRAKFLNIVMK